jgi:hypothetical protein
MSRDICACRLLSGDASERTLGDAAKEGGSEPNGE